MPTTHWDFLKPGRPIIYSVDDAWFHNGLYNADLRKRQSVFFDFFELKSEDKPDKLEKLQEYIKSFSDLNNKNKYSDVISLKILIELCIKYNFSLVFSGFGFLKENFEQINKKSEQVAVLLDFAERVGEIDTYEDQYTGYILLLDIVKKTFPFIPKTHIFFFTSRLKELHEQLHNESIDGHIRWMLRHFLCVEKPNIVFPDIENMERYERKVKKELSEFFEFFQKIIVDGREMTKQVVKTLEETILVYENTLPATRNLYESIPDSFHDNNGLRRAYNSGHPNSFNDLVRDYPDTPLCELYREGDLKSFNALYQYCMSEILNHPQKGAGSRECKIGVIAEHLRMAGIYATVENPDKLWFLPVQPGCVFLINLINFLDVLNKQSPVQVRLLEDQKILIEFDELHSKGPSTLIQTLMTTSSGTTTDALRCLLGCNTAKALQGVKISNIAQRVLLALPYPEKIGDRKDHYPLMIKCKDEDKNLILYWS